MSELMGEVGRLEFGVRSAFEVGRMLLDNVGTRVREVYWPDEAEPWLHKIAACPEDNCQAKDLHHFSYLASNLARGTEYLQESTMICRRARDLGAFRDIVTLPDRARVHVEARTRYVRYAGSAVLRRENSLSVCCDKTGQRFMLTEYNRVAGYDDHPPEIRQKISRRSPSTYDLDRLHMLRIATIVRADCK